MPRVRVSPLGPKPVISSRNHRLCHLFGECLFFVYGCEISVKPCPLLARQFPILSDTILQKPVCKIERTVSQTEKPGCKNRIPVQTSTLRIKGRNAPDFWGVSRLCAVFREESVCLPYPRRKVHTGASTAILVVIQRPKNAASQATSARLTIAFCLVSVIICWFVRIDNSNPN